MQGFLIGDCLGYWKFDISGISYLKALKVLSTMNDELSTMNHQHLTFNLLLSLQ
jgi:hypothetical protein